MADESTQLIIPGSDTLAEGPAVRAVRATLRALGRRGARNRAENTTKAYEVAWTRYGRWCDLLGCEPFPVTPVQLVGHLEWLSETHRPNTVRQALSAIATVDRDGRFTPYDTDPVSITRHYLVQEWLKGWSREHPLRPRKAAVMPAPDLWRLLDIVNTPTPRCARTAHVMRATRDKALLLVGIYGGLRVSELAALDTTDVELVERGLQLTLNTPTKTNVRKAPDIVNIMPSGIVGICPVTAWCTWLRARGEWKGPAWVGIDRAGRIEGKLHKRTIEKLIKNYARRAEIALVEREDGTKETRVSSHTMRRTLCTVARENGARVEDIMRHTRHRSVQTVLSYCDPVDKWERNVSMGLFEGKLGG